MMTEQQQTATDVNEQTRERARALDEIRQLGLAVYPHKFDRTHTISEIVKEFASRSAEELESAPFKVRVAGRVHAINKMGKAAFIRFTDGIEVLQIYIKSNEIDEQTWELFKLLHLGDMIGAAGELFRTRTGELSIHAESLSFLAKALTPPPDKYYGLHDKEVRYRQRYADLIANRDVRDVFEKRSKIIRLIRAYFDERGYVEVETPMLTQLPTGAAARPFITHHNALDIALYARIAPELYLKRLIVGGFEKVYEINRNFRNEGLSWRHNPEFTMLEWYQAYSNYEDLITLTEDLISTVALQVCGTEQVEYGDRQIDFARPWARMTMREAVAHYWKEGEDRPTTDELSSREGLLGLIERSGYADLKSQLSTLKSKGYGYLLGDLFEHVAEGHLVNPIFITEFPTELSPLSKQSEHDPKFTDRFELFIAGMEVANGFSEINDPVDQRQRFEAQMQLREGGDEEAMLIDEDYIRALSYGMPPTAGEGIGIDRLAMVLTNQKSIRDVILFPHMRPERQGSI
jgi:lysyl-tRNA synthetase class 2